MFLNVKSLLKDLTESVENRNFPKAMKIVNIMRKFDAIYEAIGENENLKIQLSAAEKVSEDLLKRNKELHLRLHVI